MNALAGDLW